MKVQVLFVKVHASYQYPCYFYQMVATKYQTYCLNVVQDQDYFIPHLLLMIFLNPIMSYTSSTYLCYLLVFAIVFKDHYFSKF